MFDISSLRNFTPIVISFLGSLLTFVGDMFDGNTAVLNECHTDFHL